MPASYRMSASGSDPRVKALAHTTLNAALRTCPRGAGHMFQPSYGLKDFSKTGCIYNVVSAYTLCIISHLTLLHV